MIKAPKIMIQAVKNVHPAKRRAAALLGERVFFAALSKYRSWGDFHALDQYHAFGDLDAFLAQHQSWADIDEAANIELAAEDAAAEIAYRFA